MTFTEFPEEHNAGTLLMENLDALRGLANGSEVVDLGVQISRDGRVWLCVNGIALVRFKPTPGREPEHPILGEVVEEEQADAPVVPTLYSKVALAIRAARNAAFELSANGGIQAVTSTSLAGNLERIYAELDRAGVDSTWIDVRALEARSFVWSNRDKLYTTAFDTFFWDEAARLNAAPHVEG